MVAGGRAERAWTRGAGMDAWLDCLGDRLEESWVIAEIAARRLAPALEKMADP